MMLRAARRLAPVFGLVFTACGDPPGSGSGGATSSDDESGESSGPGGPSSGEAPTGEAPTGESGETGSAAGPTWHQDIAPLVIGKCGGCHVAGGIAPFSLQGYEEAAPFAEAMLMALERGTMPPFLAANTDECEVRYEWEDDPRLTPAQLEDFARWVEAGAPAGDPAAAAPLPEPIDLSLQDADMRLDIETEVTIEGDKDTFLCFSLDPGFTEDTWLDGLQIRAGNPKIVHHVLVYLDPEAQSADLVGPEGHYPCFGGPGFGDTGLIGAWAPGSVPFEMPPDTAMQVKAGSRIVLNVHYHPTGAPERDDSTGIDLRRYDAALPTYVGLLALIGNGGGAAEGLQPGPGDDGPPKFKIPAGAVGHTEEMLISPSGQIPELRIFGVSSHMHYVGTDMMIGVQRNTPVDGAPDVECLLQTPRWDFNWQRLYTYKASLAEVPLVHGGDDLYLRCTYDNSMANPAVAEALADQGLAAPQDVYLGESTLDEMCLGAFAVAVKLSDVI
ncbi:MAG: hypothetical protein JNL82_27520 [Myxococcales bacterium]|nr:hypothetical protein [Myxococcales bacterium]